MSASGEPPTASSILLQGSTQSVAGIPFGDGVRCVGGSLKRMAIWHAVGGSVACSSGMEASTAVTNVLEFGPGQAR